MSPAVFIAFFASPPVTRVGGLAAPPPQVKPAARKPKSTSPRRRKRFSARTLAQVVAV
jgi:hypothetical protein